MMPAPRPGIARMTGLVGWPVEHSVSPAMHNAAYAAVGLDWCYLPFPVPPERLAEAIARVRALGMAGVNVTVPHKQAVLSLMDELSPAAAAIGAVNTVIVADGRLVGHNTDAAGFLRALREAGCEPTGLPTLVLGAGGAARAVVYALLGVGADVTVLNRTPQRAEALVTCSLRRASDAACRTAGRGHPAGAGTAGAPGSQRHKCGHVAC